MAPAPGFGLCHATPADQTVTDTAAFTTALQSAIRAASDAPFVRPDKTVFAAIPSESIDYAVMEKCPGSNFPIQMVALNAGWNDLGAWDAVLVADRSQSQNVKKIVGMLETQQRAELSLHRKVHRLKNPGSIPLEIIEVQSGSYLGEDDIVRFEDTYGRTKPDRSSQ